MINCSFESLGLSDQSQTMERIKEFGFQELTQIPANAIPPLLLWMDLLGAARKCAGKTYVFIILAVELLRNLACSSRNGTVVIVLCWTYELLIDVES